MQSRASPAPHKAAVTMLSRTLRSTRSLYRLAEAHKPARPRRHLALSGVHSLHGLWVRVSRGLPNTESGLGRHGGLDRTVTRLVPSPDPRTIPPPSRATE